MEVFSTDTEANEPAPPRAEQDQEIAQSITATLQLIERIEHNPNIAARLAEAGYDADRLQEGKVLSELVQEHYDRRQEVLWQRNRLGDQLAELEDAVNKTFSDYRVVARALFSDSNDRRQLGVSGHRSRDRQKMLTAIHAAFSNARKEPYLATFARHGYTPERFDEHSQQLEDLRKLDIEQDSAQLLAVEATRIRDEGAAQLSAWVSSLRNIAKRTLRDSPNWLDVLKV